MRQPENNSEIQFSPELKSLMSFKKDALFKTFHLLNLVELAEEYKYDYTSDELETLYDSFRRDSAILKNSK